MIIKKYRNLSNTIHDIKSSFSHLTSVALLEERKTRKGKNIYILSKSIKTT